MKVVGFEQGSVTLKLSAAECDELSKALAVADSPLGDAFRVFARVASAQARRALTVRVLLASLSAVQQSRAIVSVD